MKLVIGGLVLAAAAVVVISLIFVGSQGGAGLRDVGLAVALVTAPPVDDDGIGACYLMPWPGRIVADPVSGTAWVEEGQRPVPLAWP
jgi:hypothetical protein